jgi:hypothetical protein
MLVASGGAMIRAFLAMSISFLFLNACAGAGRSGPRTRVGDIPADLYVTEDGTPAIQSKDKTKPLLAGKMVCVMERPTGSNIAERICRYQETSDVKARETQEMLLTMPHHSPCGNDKCPGSGGNAGVP